ncbi:predicted protein [Histoplasma mississippiense (nom. inval.)]|nr:predicted protein [Histoplasma mississippiense (nom. inval.)]EDN03196.1 predicted protein [Histoplasma mississippiense (nom. inval.)]
MSSSTIPERSSQQYGPGDLPTKIVEDEDEHAYQMEGADGQIDNGTVSKQPSQHIMRPDTGRMVA